MGSGAAGAGLGAPAPGADLAVPLCPRSTNSRWPRLLSVPSKWPWRSWMLSSGYVDFPICLSPCVYPFYSYHLPWPEAILRSGRVKEGRLAAPRPSRSPPKTTKTPPIRHGARQGGGGSSPVPVPGCQRGTGSLRQPHWACAGRPQPSRSPLSPGVPLRGRSMRDVPWLCRSCRPARWLPRSRLAGLSLPAQILGGFFQI